jgi:polyribonucleotide nucleotidyltransferase
MNPITHTFEIGDGKAITLETGKLAKQANGSVLLRQGDTMLLATVVAAKEPKPGTDFLPLSVDYQERFASVGRIPGSFMKREGRLSDYEILISRIVDRAIRPLFPEDYHADVQISLMLHSSDKNILPDALVGLAASAALSLTNLPFKGPISEVRVAKIDGKLVINPMKDELERATLEFIVAGNAQDINMVEGEASEIGEEEMIEALKFAHAAIKNHIAEINTFVEKAGGKKPVLEYHHDDNDEALRARIREFAYQRIYDAASTPSGKDARSAAFDSIFSEFKATMTEEELELKGAMAKRYFGDVKYDAVRDMVLHLRQRLDGRKLNEIRPIWCEPNFLPMTHGSALFTRGETQALATVTLGTKLDEMLLDSPMNQGYSRYFLHYNFPSFSTGEVKPNRGPGRREIGHGNLAQRSLERMLPGEGENPYTVRIVSDILESNGSSSMATVCAGSMALMDSGLKVKGGVSGIAMGMISNEKGEYAILSDILGDEDHLGDMDFKVTGTANGIVGCQMDIKVHGLSYNVLAEALNQAKEGRLHILNEMNKAISKPNADLKPHAPRIESMEIDSEFIGAVIGPGGKVIQQMQKDTGTIITITEKDKKGIIEIASNNAENLAAARKKIMAIVAVPVVGEVYDGIVKSIMPYGAFVEYLPGKDGLLHISEVMWKRLESLEGVLNVGDQIKVKLIEIDSKTGKVKLSRKALLEKPDQAKG